MESVFENIKCNLCGADNYTVKYKPIKTEYNPAEVFSASGSITGTQQIVKCNVCGFIYVQPRIKANVVKDAYKNSTDELYVSQAGARLDTFKKYMKLVAEYSPKKGKILDVGAAAGFFLKTAKDEGWDVSGVEPSQWLCDWAKKQLNLSITNGILREAKYPDSNFDVVTMWDVLEHTTDAMADLVEVKRILKKDGILIINYPDIGVLMSKLAGSKWWFLLSGHLFYFDQKTIKKMLEKAGFEVLNFKMHFQSMELGHLAKMLSLYSKPISVFTKKVFSILGISKLHLKYYASQTNVIARKV